MNVSPTAIRGVEAELQRLKAENEWRQLVIDVMQKYAAEHPGERHTIEEWVELLQDDVYREDMDRWYTKHPQYRPIQKAAAATDEQENTR